MFNIIIAIYILVECKLGSIAVYVVNIFDKIGLYFIQAYLLDGNCFICNLFLNFNL